jgi:hypothetical protein
VWLDATLHLAIVCPMAELNYHPSSLEVDNLGPNAKVVAPLIAHLVPNLIALLEGQVSRLHLLRKHQETDQRLGQPQPVPSRQQEHPDSLLQPF